MTNTAAGTLNNQARLLEDAQTDIRLLVKDSVIHREPWTFIGEKVKKLLAAVVKAITIKDLKKAAAESLWRFAYKQYKTYKDLFGGDFATFALLLVTASNKPDTERKRAFDKLVKAGKITTEKGGKGIYIPKMQVNQYGVPNRVFMRDYMHEQVKPVLDRLVKDFALDPDDIDGRNSLRNRAEMEVRYDFHIRQIEGYKAKGVKLVICSTHSDASPRCAPHQGKVFSLDGTYGTTDDGRPYEPLENATDVWYTTKAGKRYKNGLLGFNCRHHLVEYKTGFAFPEPDAEKERKEYAITKQQRYLERQTRHFETVALTAKGVDWKTYEQAKKLAQQWKAEYIRFSHDNGRAYYPSRIEVI